MDHLFAGTRTRSRLEIGPFGPHLDLLGSIATARLAQGYAPETVRSQVRTVADFGEWLVNEAISTSGVTAQTLEKFLKTPSHWGRGLGGVARDLLRSLQAAHVCPQPTSCETPPVQIVEDFMRYLQHERGLCVSTIHAYGYIIKQLLVERFGDAEVRPAELSAPDADAFVLRHAKRGHKTNANMVAALRSFFRFLRVRGLVGVDLAAAILGAATWRLQDVPKGLEPGDVEKLLQHCSRDTAECRRDYAILLLLARLGLRGGEVTRLCLEDIDWEAGEIIVCGKGRRLQRLPMPQDVGRAIADYLRQGRPVQAETRRVFVRARPPYRGFASTVAVCCIMRRRLRQAGLTPARRGAHLLRHGLATKMLSHGASLAEIGQLLRHQHIDTTAIYAKVALNALRPLALPWPGGEG